LLLLIFRVATRSPEPLAPVRDEMPNLRETKLERRHRLLEKAPPLESRLPFTKSDSEGIPE
jgi:hypothetical protein